MTNRLNRTGCAAIGVAILGILLASGCSRQNAASQKNAAADPPRNVRTFCVATTSLQRTVVAFGSLAAFDQAVLRTKVQGRLQSIEVDLGSAVKEGDLLARVEPRDYELRVRQSEALLAQARVRLGLAPEAPDDQFDVEKASTVMERQAVLDEARANRERIKALSEQGILSRSDLESADAAYEVAFNRHRESLDDARNRIALVAQRRAELDIARQQLADTQLKAPFAGSVQERHANHGEFLMENAPVVTLVCADPLRLKVDVAERDAHKVQPGQTVRLTIKGNTNVYTGEIKRLSPAIDERTRVLRVEADVPNPGSLRPGIFVRTEIVVDENSPGIAIPKGALVRFAGIEKVFVLHEGRIAERQVASGQATDDTIEIVSGLRPGDFVVIEPNSVRAGQAANSAN